MIDFYQRSCADYVAVCMPLDVMTRLYKAFITLLFGVLWSVINILVGIGKVVEKKLKDTNYYIIISKLGLSSSMEYDNIIRSFEHGITL